MRRCLLAQMRSLACPLPPAPSLAPRPPAAARRAAAAAGKGSSAAPSEAALAKGCLVAFERDSGGGRETLAVLTRPDGKKNWFGTDGEGGQHSIRPQAVRLALPPSPAWDEWRALAPLAATAAARSAAAPLSDAWALLAGGDGSELAELASNLL
jgi:hypothetical protein